MPRGPNPMPVIIRGKVYPDARAAAKALGVTHRTINNLVARGRADQAGIGCGNHGQTIGHSHKPVKIGNRVYRSIGQAAKELGACRKTIRKYFLQQSEDDASREAT